MNSQETELGNAGMIRSKVSPILSKSLFLIVLYLTVRGFPDLDVSIRDNS